MSDHDDLQTAARRIALEAVAAKQVRKGELGRTLIDDPGVSRDALRAAFLDGLWGWLPGIRRPGEPAVLTDEGRAFLGIERQAA
jgi:hypothetical protein